jgi:hypothetical protein
MIWLSAIPFNKRPLPQDEDQCIRTPEILRARPEDSMHLTKAEMRRNFLQTTAMGERKLPALLQQTSFLIAFKYLRKHL